MIDDRIIDACAGFCAIVIIAFSVFQAWRGCKGLCRILSTDPAPGRSLPDVVVLPPASEKGSVSEQSIYELFDALNQLVDQVRKCGDKNRLDTRKFLELSRKNGPVWCVKHAFDAVTWDEQNVELWAKIQRFYSAHVIPIAPIGVDESAYNAVASLCDDMSLGVIGVFAICFTVVYEVNAGKWGKQGSRFEALSGKSLEFWHHMVGSMIANVCGGGAPDASVRMPPVSEKALKATRNLFIS